MLKLKAYVLDCCGLLESTTFRVKLARPAHPFTGVPASVLVPLVVVKLARDRQVGRAPALTLPGGAVGTAYSGTLSVSGGTEPCIWSISSGALPARLSIASASTTTGANSIIGSPVTACAGNFSFTVKVTDSSSPAQVSIQPMSVTILGITTTTLPAASLGVAYNQTLAAVGGSGSYTWSVSAGEFPSVHLPGTRRLDGSNYRNTRVRLLEYLHLHGAGEGHQHATTRHH